MLYYSNSLLFYLMVTLLGDGAEMTYNTSEDHDQELYANFQRSAPREVVIFDENWHRIRDESVLGMKSNCGNFFNFTNTWL